MDRTTELTWLTQTHERNCADFAEVARLLCRRHHPTVETALRARLRFLLAENQTRAEKIVTLALAEPCSSSPNDETPGRPATTPPT